MQDPATKEEEEETGTASRVGGWNQEKNQMTFTKNVRDIPEKTTAANRP